MCRQQGTACFPATYSNSLVRLFLFCLLLFRLLQVRLVLFVYSTFFLLFASICSIVVKFWFTKDLHAFVEVFGGIAHPLTSNDVQIPKIDSNIVELFKTEQAATEVSLLQLETGGVVAPTRRVFRHKEKRLKTIQEKFLNNEYSLDEYISALG